MPSHKDGVRIDGGLRQLYTIFIERAEMRRCPDERPDKGFKIALPASERQQEPSTLTDIPKILIVEPDTSLRDKLMDFFKSAGHRPLAAADSTQTLDAEVADPDLVIFHCTDPGAGGRSIRELRRVFPQAEIIAMSYQADTNAKVGALDDGADDFLPKPIDIEELGARARARLRRRMKSGRKDPRVRIGAIEFDAANHSVTIDGHSIALSRKEFDLFQVFAQNPEVVLSHRFLISQIWSEQVDTQYIRIYVSQLRSKIEPDPAKPSYIITQPGRGYLFCSKRLERTAVIPLGRQAVLAI